jgi:integrase
MQYGELYHRNFYKEVQDKNRVYYEYYHLDGFENFHFHQLRHTYTSNLLSNGAAPKDVQELLGHSDVSTTMNVYAHSTRKAKRNSARLLDKVAGND